MSDKDELYFNARLPVVAARLLDISDGAFVRFINACADSIVQEAKDRGDPFPAFATSACAEAELSPRARALLHALAGTPLQAIVHASKPGKGLAHTKTHKGGKARAAALTPARRSAIAKKAAKTRWGK